MWQKITTDGTKVCLSDRIGYYLDYLHKRFSGEKDIEEIMKLSNELYKDIRGDFYLVGKDPRMVAGGIFWYAVKSCDTTLVTMDIAIALGSNNAGGISKHYKQLRTHFSSRFDSR